MATGGRVLHHLTAALPDAKNTVLFVGYQAAGTRGRALVDGIHEVKMLGRVIPVMAAIEQLDSMSAHADANEVMRWLSGFSQAPTMTYLVHGEPAALRALAERIRARAFLARPYRAAPGTGRARPGIGLEDRAKTQSAEGRAAEGKRFT